MKIELETMEDFCKNIAEIWYNNYRGWIQIKRIIPGGLDAAKIWKELKALEGRGTEDQIAAIIGNRNWTRYGCSICKDQNLLKWIVTSDDEKVLVICPSCVRKMEKLMK